MGTKTGKPVSNEQIVQIQESQEILDAIISSSFDAIVAIDTKKNIIEFNHQAELLTGYRQSEMSGQQVEKLYEDKDKAGEIYRAIQLNKRIDQTDIILLHKDGSQIPVSLSGKLIISKTGEILAPGRISQGSTRIHLLEARLKSPHRFFKGD